MRNPVAAGLLLALCASSVLAGTAPKRSLEVPTVDAPPKIDGVLDDAIWKKAAEGTDYRLPLGPVAQGKSRFLVARDGGNLYLAAECFDGADALARLKAGVTKRDGEGIWEDDEVEFFIDPTGKRVSYYQIIINSKGTLFDAYCPEPRKGDNSWNPECSAAASVAKGSWTVELSVPLKAFDRTKASAGTWAFNATRMRPAAGEFSCWSPLMAASAHTPEGFGTLTGMPEMELNPEADTVKAAPARVEETVEKFLFGFEEPRQIEAWEMAPKAPNQKEDEPAAKMDLSKENATSGLHSMRITYDCGWFPMVTTDAVPGDWSGYQTLKADVTVPRPMVAGFRLMQEKSSNELGYTPALTRWECTQFLRKGTNQVSLALHKVHPHRSAPLKADRGSVVSMQFYVYGPKKGESVFLDGIRVSNRLDPQAGNLKPAAQAAPTPKFKVLGTSLEVTGVGDLGSKLKDKWAAPKPATLEEVEAGFRAFHEKHRRSRRNRGAVLAVFRQGQKGYDPGAPDKAYAGWENVYVNCHGPDGNILDQGSTHTDRYGMLETFMRHRGQMIRIDVSSIPAGSRILGAKLILVSTDKKAPDKPNMFVAEACNRPWNAGEVNAFRYAAGRFWRSYSGQYWYGDDPDFLPVYLAHGPALGEVNVWDFTEAVGFWTKGDRPNHGLFFHGDSGFYWRAFTSNHKDLRRRPALMVVYVPAK